MDGGVCECVGVGMAYVCKINRLLTETKSLLKGLWSCLTARAA